MTVASFEMYRILRLYVPVHGIPGSRRVSVYSSHAWKDPGASLTP